MLPPSIQKLINLFSKFPTVGKKTASRFVFYLVKMPQEKYNEFVSALEELKNNIKICGFCFNPYETSNGGHESLCSICENSKRDKSVLCIVEKESDLIAIENTKNYKGLYFILGGVFASFKKDADEKIRTKELIERIKEPKKFNISSDFKEIIIAINPTPEGEATALSLERELKPLGIKTTRLGLGLPVGGELEYADEETLKSSFEGRK